MADPVYTRTAGAVAVFVAITSTPTGIADVSSTVDIRLRTISHSVVTSWRYAHTVDAVSIDAVSVAIAGEPIRAWSAIVTSTVDACLRTVLDFVGARRIAAASAFTDEAQAV